MKKEEKVNWSFGDFYHFQKFRIDFIDCITQYDLENARSSLYNMNVEAKRILKKLEKLLEPPINISKIINKIIKEGDEKNG